jgi:hypothetical protein
MNSPENIPAGLDVVRFPADCNDKNACPQDQSSSMAAGCAAKTLCPAAM